jgi:hypothetical protein
MRKKAFSISIVLVILFGVAIFVLPSSPFRSRAGVTVNISNPYKNYANNVKVNFHDHSNASVSGADTPANVGNWYKNAGYKGYSISDEQKMTPNPNVSGITWLGLAEEQAVAGKELVHINGKTNQTGTNLQSAIDAIKSQGGRSIAIHPNGTTAGDPGWDNAALVGVNNLLGLEIYNPKVGGIATSKWDYALSKGKKYWGFAFDDSKNATERGKGLIVVNASSATPTQADLLAQIYAGNFYATSRPTSTSNFYDLKVVRSNLNLTFSTTVGTKIRLVKAGATAGTTIVTAGKSTTYTVKGDEKYVRAEVLDVNGRAVAWSQPIYTSQTVTTTTGTVSTTANNESSGGDASNITSESTETTGEGGTDEVTTEEFTADEGEVVTDGTGAIEEAATETTVAGNKKFNIYLIIGTIILLLGGIGVTVFFYLKRRGINHNMEAPSPVAPETVAPGSFLADAQNRMESMAEPQNPAPAPIEPSTGYPEAFNPPAAPATPNMAVPNPSQLPPSASPEIQNPSSLAGPINGANPANPSTTPPINPPDQNPL